MALHIHKQLLQLAGSIFPVIFMLKRAVIFIVGDLET